MASIRKITNTPTLVSITKTRRIREDNLPISVAQAIDAPPETRNQSDTADQTHHAPKEFDEILTEAPLKTTLSDIQLTIEQLDSAKDVVEILDKEKPDQVDRSLQANEAYRTLRQPDEEKTSVGTV